MKRIASRGFVLFAAGLLLTGLAMPAAGDVIAYDGFETYTAAAGLNGNNGGDGWGAGWAAVAASTVQNASLSYTNGSISVDGGAKAMQVQQTGSGGVTAASRALDAAETDVLYFSFLLKPLGLDTNDGASFRFSNDADKLNAASAEFSTNSGKAYFARLLGDNTTQNTTGLTTAAAAVNTTDFIVVKVYKSVSGAGNNYDRGTVFVNPNNDAAESGTTVTPLVRDIKIAGLLTFGIDAVDMAHSTSYFLFDELRVATTWNEVVTPEPATVTLLGLGLVPAILRRRRC